MLPLHLSVFSFWPWLRMTTYPKHGRQCFITAVPTTSKFARNILRCVVCKLLSLCEKKIVVCSWYMTLRSTLPYASGPSVTRDLWLSKILSKFFIRSFLLVTVDSRSFSYSQTSMDEKGLPQLSLANSLWLVWNVSLRNRSHISRGKQTARSLLE